MTSITVNIKEIISQKERLYMPSFMIKDLQLMIDQNVPIFFGIGNSRNVKIMPMDIKQSTIVITSKLKETLSIPFVKQLVIRKEDEGLRIGPIIGILTTDYTGKKFTNIVPKAEHPFSVFFRGLLTPEPYYPAFYFVFTPEHVDWYTKRIKGYFYSQKKKWEIIEVPFPDVIYNRIPNRTIEKKDYITYFKKEYLRIGGKLFNPDFFNKWDMYQILTERDSIRQYIPETYHSPTITTLKNLTEKYPIVYLKPANGSLGLGIYKILKKKNDYVVQYRNKEQNKSITYRKLAALYQTIFSQKYQQRYLLQQGIDLIEYSNSPVDFRIQLHKNKVNEWEVIAIGAKVAGKGSVTTHLRTGGKMIDTYQFLKMVFADQAIYMEDKIKITSIEIAKTVEEKLNSPIGELGLDIGIDKNGHIWLFEVNSKPGRSIFKHPSLKVAREESSKRLLEYAIYLSDLYTTIT